MDMLNKSEIITNELLSKIRSGELSGKMPSDLKIATEYKTARMTAARALTILQERGVVVRVPRKGTFVISGKNNKVRIFCQAQFFAVFSKYMAKHHPDIELENVKFGETADLMVLTTYGMYCDYEKFLIPFSRVSSEKITKSGRFWPECLELHRRNGQLYGVPFLFSPIIMHYNREIMHQIEPIFDAVNFDFAHSFELIDRAEALGFYGVDHCRFVHSLLLVLVNNMAPDEVNSSDFVEAAKIIRKIVQHSKDGSFGTGKTLFAFSPRQIALYPDFTNYDVAPMPTLNGNRCCAVASESLVVTRHASEPERLHDICEETLSPEFQRLITAGKYGIASDRSIAYDSMESSMRRDDFYFTEVKNMRMVHRRYKNSMLQEINLLVEDYISQTIAYEEFESGLICALQNQKHEEERRKRFEKLNNISVRDSRHGEEN